MLLYKVDTAEFMRQRAVLSELLEGKHLRKRISDIELEERQQEVSVIKTRNILETGEISSSDLDRLMNNMQNQSNIKPRTVKNISWKEVWASPAITPELIIKYSNKLTVTNLNLLLKKHRSEDFMSMLAEAFCKEVVETGDSESIRFSMFSGFDLKVSQVEKLVKNFSWSSDISSVAKSKYVSSWKVARSVIRAKSRQLNVELASNKDLNARAVDYLAERARSFPLIQQLSKKVLSEDQYAGMFENLSEDDIFDLWNSSQVRSFALIKSIKRSVSSEFFELVDFNYQARVDGSIRREAARNLEFDGSLPVEWMVKLVDAEIENALLSVSSKS